MKIETAFARIVSILFHPLFIPTAGMILLFRLNTYINFSVPDPAKRFILVILFVNTALAPALSVFLLQRTRLIQEVVPGGRYDRLLPLLISSMFYILTYYLMRQLSLPSLVNYYIMGATMLVLVCLVISFRWRISLHMASLGGLTGFFIATSLLLQTDIAWLIMITFLVSGFVGSARMILHHHHPMQIYGGFLTGLGVMLLLYSYLKG